MTARVLIVGSGAREHAIAAASARSAHGPRLACFGSSRNPGISKVCEAYTVGKLTDAAAVVAFARHAGCTLAVIGPEAPLAAGVADALWVAGIPTVGPRQRLAQIESSKSFTRALLQTHGIAGNPRFQRFASIEAAEPMLRELAGRHVIKDDGLAGGKGVKVCGDQLHSHYDSLRFCRELVAAGRPFVVEEKLEGEEFSLLSFTDGTTLRHMPVVQDHKRAFAGDRGPNTGGMGTYTDCDGSLPFLHAADTAAAQRTNEAVVAALGARLGAPFQGVLYGGFMATNEGVRLIEYNARFGDPESLNLLALLETDLLTIFEAIVQERLHEVEITFRAAASVCKYLVPEGYPDAPRTGDEIRVPADPGHDEAIYLGAVDELARDGREILVATGSRAVACVAVAESLDSAERHCEALVRRVEGRLVHRADIGTAGLIGRRVEHMRQLRETPALVGTTR